MNEQQVEDRNATPDVHRIGGSCGCADNGDVEHCERPASPTQETP